jgi:hypothetical protein
VCLGKNLKSEGAAKYHNIFYFFIIHHAKTLNSEEMQKTDFP